MSSIQRCRKYFQFPLAIIVFNPILLYVDDPETMKSVLTAPECLNKTFLQNGFYTNKGLLHAKDEQWKIRRKQLQPAFSHNCLIGFFGIFNRVAYKLKQKMSNNLTGDQVHFKSLEDLVTRAVLQISCLTIMGTEMDFLEQDKNCIAQAYSYLMEITALRVLRPWYQIDFIFSLLDNENYEKSKKANKLVQEFVENIVQHKFIEWKNNKHRQHQKADIRSSTSGNETETETNRANNEMLLNKHKENHNFTGNTVAVGNDAFKNIANGILSMPDTNLNLNVFMPKQLQQEQQQQQRIFIDQIFYLAQTGKLTLHDIMNESQSMVVVSFETVSTCLINSLLCLAINHDCQTKLRHEIKQMQSKPKSKIKNKPNTRTKVTSIAQDIEAIKKFKTCPCTIDVDLKATSALGDKNKVTNTCNCNNDYVDEEINDNVNHDDDDDDVEVTMEDLLNMPYLDMIINESLRLLTSVPMNLRNVSADFQLNAIQRDKCICNTKNCNNKVNFSCSSCQRCVVVPKDTIIALDTFNMQRNEMYWGKNALKFHPEHFKKISPTPEHHKSGKENEVEWKTVETPITSTTETITSRHAYTFLPFLKRLRNCIGYSYSIYLSKIVLIKLISSFDISTNIQLQDLQYYESISLKFRNAENIHFKVHPVH